MATFEMLRRVTLVKTDVSDELGAFIIKVTRIGELGTTLAVTGRVTSQKTPFFKAKKNKSTHKATQTV
jgi:hypothetical protein